MGDKGAIEFKVVVLGDKGVGKTCLVLRFIEGYFAPKQQSTIGAFFLTKKMVLADGTNCKMQLWDTAGQERFRAMAPMYYRNAAAAIVCFDITNEDSFTKMKDWVEELKQNVAADQLVLAIACNKADLESLRVISRSRAEQFAQRVNAILYETSAKENFGVEEIFKKITEEVVARLVASRAAATEASAPAPATGTIKGQQLGAAPPGEAKSNSSGCC